MVSKILEKMGDEIENNPEAKLRLKIAASVMYGGMVFVDLQYSIS